VNVKVVPEMQWARSVSRSFLSGSQYFVGFHLQCIIAVDVGVFAHIVGYEHSNEVVIEKQYVENDCKERRMYG